MHSLLTISFVLFAAAACVFARPQQTINLDDQIKQAALDLYNSVFPTELENDGAWNLHEDLSEEEDLQFVRDRRNAESNSKEHHEHHEHDDHTKCDHEHAEHKEDHARKRRTPNDCACSSEEHKNAVKHAENGDEAHDDHHDHTATKDEHHKHAKRSADNKSQSSEESSEEKGVKNPKHAHHHGDKHAEHKAAEDTAHHDDHVDHAGNKDETAHADHAEKQKQEEHSV